MESNDGSGNGLKLAGATLGGGAIAGTAVLGVSGAGSPLTWAVLAGGLVLVALMLLAYIILVRRRVSKRAAAADRTLLDIMRVRPRNVRDPALIARLDRLSEKFEEGLTKFHRATGQRISESPWYLLVGEPGSGKTEAIRRCGVELPAGLHEEQQGAGGTTNMDWWFTEEAIILDTAGRYALEAERAAGPAAAAEPTEQEEQARAQTEAEWLEFLKLINKTRPDCPVNGLLLVIPATSLIVDDGNDVQRKARTLAKFLDTIRRTLEVRFPVFVLVTKSDLIPGFREFFEHIQDPSLQQQMLGWTKPGSLDDPFDPAEVDKYLGTVRDKLYRRRLTLLQDPVHTEVPGERRTDQVDTLYTFPDRFAALGPKLRQYLQLVFVKNKFNQNPLFLRGIYFTSSMEQGAALDETLARIRGISINQLEEEERGFRKDRPIFLRDLFLRKVFVENGLVTRESNTRSVKRKRQVATLTAAIVALVVLGGFLFYSYRELKSAVLAEASLTEQVVNSRSADSSKSWDLFRAKTVPTTQRTAQQQQFVFDEGAHPSDAVEQPVGWYYTKRMDEARARLPVPAMFAWVNAMFAGQDPNALRRKSADSMYQAHVLRPLMREGARRMASDDLPAAEWGKANSPASTALLLLLGVDAMPRDAAGSATSRPAPDVPGEQAIDALARFTLADANYEAFRKDYATPLGRQLDAVADGKLTQTLAAVAPRDGTLNKAASRGVAQFGKYWESVLSLDAENSPFAGLQALQRDVASYGEQFDAIEKTLGDKPAATIEDYQQRCAAAREMIAQLRVRAARVDDAMKRLDENELLKSKTPISLVDRVNNAIEHVSTDAKPLYDRMIVAAGGAQTANGRALADSLTRVGEMGKDRKIQELVVALANINAKYLADANGKPAYAASVDLLDAAAAELIDPAAEPRADGPKPDATLDAADARLKASRDALLNRLGKPADPASLTARVDACAGKLIDALAAPAQRYVVAHRLIGEMPAEADAVAKLVVDATRDANLFDVRIPALPLQQPIDPDVTEGLNSYHPDAAKIVLARVTSVRTQLSGDARNTPILEQDTLGRDLNDRSKGVIEYEGRYHEFWRTLDARFAVPMEFDSWAKFQSEIGKARPDEIHRSIVKVLLKQLEAFEKISPFVDAQTREEIRREGSDLAARRDEPADAKLNGMVRAWSAMDDTAAEAARKLASQPAATFRYACFPGGDGQPYLTQLFLNGLKALAQEQANAGGGVVARAFNGFMADWGDKFPCVHGSGAFPPTAKMIAPGELPMAIAALDLALPPDAVANAAAGETVIGMGGKTDVLAIDEQLAKIVGTPPSASQIAGLRRSRALLMLVKQIYDAKRNATMTIAAIPPPKGRDLPGVPSADQPFQNLVVQVGSKPPLNKDGVFLRTPAVVPVANVTFAGEGTAVLFTFYPNKPGDGGGVTYRIDSDRWLPLQIVALQGAQVRADEKTWEFPLVFDVKPQPGRGAQRYVQWFVLTSDDKVLPSPIVWPQQ